VAAGATYRINVNVGAQNMAPGALRSMLGEVSSFEQGINSAASAWGKLVQGIMQPIQGITSAIGGVLQGISGLAQGIMGVLTAPIAGINTLLRTFINYRTGVLAAAAGAAITWPLILASNLDQAQIAFETFLGSTEAANNMLTKLRDFANYTPFTFPELREAAGNLLAVGVNASRIIPFMTAIGDAAAGLGRGRQGIQAMSLDFQRISAQGRVTGRDLLELQREGVPALQILAQGYGTTTKQIQDWVRAGVLPANRSMRLLAEGMEQRFGGLMDKYSHTLEGLWSSVEDIINNNLLVRFGQGIEGPVKEALEGVVGWFKSGGEAVDTLGKGLQQFGTMIGGWIKSVLDQLGGSLKAVFASPEFLNAPNFFDMLGLIARRVFDDLTAKLGPFGEILQGIVNNGVPALMTVFGDLSDFMVRIGIPALQDLIKELGPHIQDAINWIKDTGWPGFKEKLADFGKWWSTDGKPAFDQLTSFLGTQLHNALDWLTTTGLPNAQPAWDKFTSAVKDAWTWLSTVWDQLSKQGVWDDLKATLGDVAGAFGDVAAIAGQTMDATTKTDTPVPAGPTPQEAAINQQLAQTGGWAQAADAQRLSAVDAQRQHVQQIQKDAQGFVEGVKTITTAIRDLADAAKALMDWLAKFDKWIMDHQGPTVKVPGPTDLPGIGPWLQAHHGLAGFFEEQIQTRQDQAANPSIAPPTVLSGTSEAQAARAAILAQHPEAKIDLQQTRVLGEAGATGEIPLSYLTQDAAQMEKEIALQMQNNPAFAKEVWSRHGGEQGKAMVEGIAQGVTEQTTASQKDFQDAQAAIQNELTWSHSPAPYFIDQGHGIIEGLIQGLNDKRDDLLDAIKRIVNDMQDALSPNAVLAAWRSGTGIVSGAGTELTTPQTTDALVAAGLSADRVADACGLIAAQGIAKGFGDAVTLPAVEKLAEERKDFTPGQGMHGAGSFEDLVGQMGYQAHEIGQQAAIAAIQQGQAVVIDTANHYFVATGYNADTGKYHVGSTGTAYAGGKTDMTMDEITALGGPVQALMDFTKSGSPMNINAAGPAGAGGNSAGSTLSGEAALRQAAAMKGIDEQTINAIISFLKTHENATLNPAAYYGHGGNTNIQAAISSGLAFGIGQEMPSTFTGYADPGHTDPTNPLDQALSTINYISKRYGGIGGLTKFAASGPYLGYQHGGPILETVFGVGSQTKLPYIFGEGGDVESYSSRMGGNGSGGVSFTVAPDAFRGAVVVQGGGPNVGELVTDALADRFMGKVADLWLDTHGNTPVRRPKT
jgi:tape measure domain-containing protein